MAAVNSVEAEGDGPGDVGEEELGTVVVEEPNFAVREEIDFDETLTPDWQLCSILPHSCLFASYCS